MPIKPNIGPTWRALYVVLGVVLIVVPFAASLEGAMRVALPIAGGLLLVGGLSGW